MELWLDDLQKPGLMLKCKVRQILHQATSPYQEILILDTEQYGKALVLDGAIHTTLLDEFVYHEMLVHVSLNTHPAPQEVLIIGGGDGGALREVLRHPEVSKATLVEIDRQVVEACRRCLPELAASFDDPRAEIHFADGIEFIKSKKDCYDVILIDSPDPVGPAVGLFSPDFYQSVYEALKSDGLMAAQSESLFFDAGLIARMYGTLSKLYPITGVLMASIPSYPGGSWSATLGSKQYDPAAPAGKISNRVPLEQLRYYTPEIHRASLHLPSFMRTALAAASKS